MKIIIKNATIYVTEHHHPQIYLNRVREAVANSHLSRNGLLKEDHNFPDEAERKIAASVERALRSDSEPKK